MGNLLAGADYRLTNQRGNFAVANIITRPPFSRRPATPYFREGRYAR